MHLTITKDHGITELSVINKGDEIPEEHRGTYLVNAAFHGIDANDSVRIADANITIDAGKDAICCENSDDTAKGFIYISNGTIKAEAEGDGIAASAYMQIEGGYIELLVGGGSESCCGKCRKSSCRNADPSEGQEREHHPGVYPGTELCSGDPVEPGTGKGRDLYHYCRSAVWRI